MRERERVRESVCVCERERVCVCVCMCVCVRGGERTGGDRETQIHPHTSHSMFLFCVLACIFCSHHHHHITFCQNTSVFFKNGANQITTVVSAVTKGNVHPFVRSFFKTTSHTVKVKRLVLQLLRIAVRVRIRLAVQLRFHHFVRLAFNLQSPIENNVRLGGHW